MDDMFNTNPINEPTPAQAPVEPTPPQQEAITGGFTTTQQQSTPYSAPYNTPYNTPYNQAPNNTAQPTGAYNQALNNMNQPIGAYNQAPENTAHFTNNTKKPKSKMNIGKGVFVALLCLCIVFSSISIGLSISNKKSGNNDNPIFSKDENKKPFDGGATANVEDSPSSFAEYSGKGTMTPEQVYKAVKEINVGVLVYSQNKMVTEGSGIVVGADKNKEYTYILTAAHVISDSNIDLQVQFSDESDIEAEIVGFDAKTDIGVIRVKKTGLKAATFGNSDKLTVGQTVYAIGNPGGTEFFGSFTGGMISAIDRPVPTQNSSYDLPCIQHNAAINPGNSGGALVNEYGQVIGLNSSKISSTEYEGMGFSVPSNTLLNVYNEIIKHGYVSNRPMLGITYFAVSSDYSYATIAWRNNFPYGSVAIATINEDSDVANHGVKVGDIITAVNGKKLETTDVLLETIEKAKVGDTITLTIHRLNSNGSVNKSFDAKVKLVEDRGTNKVVEETTQPPQVEEFDPFDPFSYFDFGY